MGRYNEHGTKKQVGGGLSLERFAEAKKSTYNKRQALEKVQEEKLRRKTKLKKLKHKLESEGKLTVGGFEVVDNIEQLERDMVSREYLEAQEARHQQRGKKRKLEETSKGAAQLMATMKEEIDVAAIVHDKAPGLSINAASFLRREQLGAAGGKTKAPSTAPPTSAKPKKHKLSVTNNNHAQTIIEAEAAGRDKGKQSRSLNQLERLSSKIQAQKQEERRAQEEAAKQRAEKQASIASAKRARQDTRHKFFMRTGSGQPLMRFRMEKILSELERDKKASGV